MNSSLLSDAIDRNLADAIRHVARHGGGALDQTGSRVLAAGRHPYRGPLLNAALRTDRRADPEAVVADALRFFGKHGHAFVIWAAAHADADLAEAALSAGLSELHDAGAGSAMALSVPPAAADLPSNAAFSVVSSREDTRSFALVAGQAFATAGQPPEVAQAVGQALGLTGPFPAALRQAIHGASLPLYREQMKYDLHVIDVDRDHLKMEFKVNYRLVNRTETSYQQTVGVVPMRPFQPIYGEIAGDELDINHPDYLTERGWQVPHNFEAGSVTNVAFVVNVTYRMPDADIFATYLPATDFELKIRFPSEKVRVVAESLLPATVRPQELARGTYVYRPPGAVLSYGGFRLDWLIPNTGG